MKKVYFINGSPKIKDSTSEYFIDLIKEMMDSSVVESETICISKSLKANTQNEAFVKMSESDSIVFAFPLYIDSIPSHMLDFLYQFDDYFKENKSDNDRRRQEVYAVINNGFVEGEHNINAVRIMQHFSNSLGFKWRFAVGVGAGEYMGGTREQSIQSKMKNNIYEAFVKLKKDIENDEVTCEKSILTNPKMPKILFNIVGSLGWITMARKNKVSIKSLYARPWEE